MLKLSKLHMGRFIIASLSLLTFSATAQIIEYRCQFEPAPVNGIWREGLATVDVDFTSGTLSSVKIGDRVLTGFEFNSDDLELGQYTEGVAPTIASFFQPNASDGFGFAVSISGKTKGVKAADVAFFMPEGDAKAYYCYRVGSLKDKVMHDLTSSHNKRILGE